LARTSEGLRGGNVVRVPPLPSLPPQTKALCTCLVRTHLGHSHLLGNGNTRPSPRLKAECEAAQHWNLTQRPSYRNPTSSRCVACARPQHQLDFCAASCPDRVLARDLRQIAAPITARNFFILPKFQISQARSPNAVPRRHASPGTRKRLA
jgi:hypothetical protein